jgi:hypothetical protein
MTHLSVITNPNAARDDADHTIVIAPEDRTIVVPPEDRTIVVPPRTPDDCVVALPDGSRWWVSLPPPVRELLPHALRAEGARKPRRPNVATLIKQAEKAGRTVTSVTVDRITLHFSSEPTEATNPWLADIEKATKQ